MSALSRVRPSSAPPSFDVEASSESRENLLKQAISRGDVALVNSLLESRSFTNRELITAGLFAIEENAGDAFRCLFNHESFPQMEFMGNVINNPHLSYLSFVFENIEFAPDNYSLFLSMACNCDFPEKVSFIIGRFDRFEDKEKWFKKAVMIVQSRLDWRSEIREYLKILKLLHARDSERFPDLFPSDVLFKIVNISIQRGYLETADYFWPIYLENTDPKLTDERFVCGSEEIKTYFLAHGYRPSKMVLIRALHNECIRNVTAGVELLKPHFDLIDPETLMTCLLISAKRDNFEIVDMLAFELISREKPFNVIHALEMSGNTKMKARIMEKYRLRDVSASASAGAGATSHPLDPRLEYLSGVFRRDVTRWSEDEAKSKALIFLTTADDPEFFNPIRSKVFDFVSGLERDYNLRIYPINGKEVDFSELQRSCEVNKVALMVFMAHGTSSGMTLSEETCLSSKILEAMHVAGKPFSFLRSRANVWFLSCSTAEDEGSIAEVFSRCVPDVLVTAPKVDVSPHDTYRVEKRPLRLTMLVDEVDVTKHFFRGEELSYA
jgi:hypothetical protein